MGKGDIVLSEREVAMLICPFEPGADRPSGQQQLPEMSPRSSPVFCLDAIFV